MGVYSRTDTNRGVHKAPANETVFCTGLSVNYNKAEQDILNPAGINLIRAIPGQGIRVWGCENSKQQLELQVCQRKTSLHLRRGEHQGQYQLGCI